MPLDIPSKDELVNNHQNVIADKAFNVLFAENMKELVATGRANIYPRIKGGEEFSVSHNVWNARVSYWIGELKANGYDAVLGSTHNGYRVIRISTLYDPR